MGMAAADELDVFEAVVPAPAGPPVPVATGVAVIPLVNGMSLTEEAPEKAGVWELAEGFGVAWVLLGFKTL
jgi:hypothetical protein